MHLSKRQKARRVFETTPGVVTAELLRWYGIHPDNVHKCGLAVERVGGLGWRLAK